MPARDRVQGQIVHLKNGGGTAHILIHTVTAQQRDVSLALVNRCLRRRLTSTVTCYMALISLNSALSQSAPRYTTELFRALPSTKTGRCFVVPHDVYTVAEHAVTLDARRKRLQRGDQTKEQPEQSVEHTCMQSQQIPPLDRELKTNLPHTTGDFSSDISRECALRR